MTRVRPASLGLEMKGPEVVVKPDYNVAIGAAALAGGLFAARAPVVAVPIAALAALFAVQAGRVRFTFDDEAFELKTSTDDPEVLSDSGENIVVGGANRWNYNTWVNYDYFPSKEFPILVYFKETQTPEEKWGEGPGGLDKKGGGQVHFFPAICNVEELDSMFKAKGLPSERYNPK
jgi:NIMA (never in mitosis gene a)-related kinase